MLVFLFYLLNIDATIQKPMPDFHHHHHRAQIIGGGERELKMKTLKNFLYFYTGEHDPLPNEDITDENISHNSSTNQINGIAINVTNENGQNVLTQLENG